MNDKNNEEKFDKVLNGWDVVVTAFGAMIGWGWVVSSGGWIQKAGVMGTVIGFLIGGLMIYFVGLVYAELTAALPKCGGEHVFGYKAFGSIGSFICTWYIILSYIGVVCFEACSLPTIVQYIFPSFMKGYLYTIAGFDVYVTWLITAIVVAALITYINILGVKAAAKLQTCLTLIIAVVGIGLVISSALNGHPVNLTSQLFNGGSFFARSKSAISIAVIAPFFLFGFDVIPQIAEEINISPKKIGKLLMLSIVLAVVFYALVVLGIGYAMNAADIASSNEKAGLVAADAIAKMFHSDVLADIMIIGGMCGILTSWNSFMIGGSRALFAMAESFMIPHRFAKLHSKYKTPYYSILLVGGLSVIAPFFGRRMLVWISDAASFSCCVAYCIVSLSFIAIRKKYPDLPRPFKIKHGSAVGIIAVIMSGFMVIAFLWPNTGSTLLIQEWIIVCGWTILGVMFACYCKNRYGEKFGSMNE